jgi:hydroxypyruvate reductase
MTALENLWHIGVNAVGGDASVRQSLHAHPITPPDQIIAVGKAATAMAGAAAALFPDAPVLIITKDGHADGAPPHAQVIEAAHPVPNAASLEAGASLLKTVQGCGPQSHLLMLVSGGASALAEVLEDGLTLADLTQRTQDKLASGADIHAINVMRRGLSRIKGGKLLGTFGGARVTTLAISDVEGDSLGVIGSGIGDAPNNVAFAHEARIVASNAIARQAIADAAGADVRSNAETLYDDVTALAPRIAAQLKAAESGLHILGGEPTVILPEAPGLGGRNMMLALLLAREITGRDDLQILVAGTDGSDGPTDAAGAVVDGQTWLSSGQNAIDTAAPYDWLAARHALLKPGPTGTNVMDLLIARKT